MTDTPWLGDACSLVDAFRSGERSPKEELEATLTAIERSELNCFSFVDADRAREAAAAERLAGWLEAGPIHGVYWLPALDRHRPDLILVSAGFDAHRDDPLAGLTLTDEDFGWVAELILAAARTHCDGKVVSALEGGYELAALDRSVQAYLAEFPSGWKPPATRP